MIITKDDREIELMTEAGRIVALVHEKLKEVIVPGITTNEIDQICDKIIQGTWCNTFLSTSLWFSK